MDTKHTPGPWKIIEVTSDTASGPTPYPRAIAGSVTVAELPERSPLCMMEERAANACLIAAAPELLSAAQDVVKMLDMGQWTTSQYSRLVELAKACAKATTPNT